MGLDLPHKMISPLLIYPHNTLLVVTCEVGFELDRPRAVVPLCNQGQWISQLQATCQRGKTLKAVIDHIY